MASPAANHQTISEMVEEAERAVLLGVVQEKQNVDDTSPYACKIGGLAAWYSPNPPVEAQSLSCPKCTKQLFLVSQVYAPVDFDRTLYVFGCNSVECTENPGSWRVLRDQKEIIQVQAQVQRVEEITTKLNNVQVGWDATSDGDSSDWSDDDDGDASKQSASQSSSGLIDLESLLQQRDDAMKLLNTNASVSKPPPQPVNSETKKEAPNAKNTSNAFPALLIDVIDEPFENYTAEHDFSHENELLQEYFKQEEEEKSADVGDLRKIIATSKKNSSKGGGSSSNTAASSSGESYEKTPAQQRRFLQFQKRINRCPLQCMRYDYGGEPLWPVPIPSNLKIPTCKCGEERVFEFQLTPTVNYFLKVDEFAAIQQKKQAPTCTTTVTGNGEQTTAAAKTLPTGMDWLSILVYCCPKSCMHSHEEFIYVLPSMTS